MCGIVLMGGSVVTENSVSLFEKLLFADTFRGPHSTGVFTGRNFITADKEIVPTCPKFKDVGIAPDFLRTWEWHNMLRSGADGDVTKFGDFYVGHNRYATMGAKTAENAHPFTYGDITMVHNGTLMDQTLLPEYEKFEVDSENVCYSINKIGADKTIQLLDGAFVLIWHDASDKTLHIIRNEERPFHLAVTTTGRWYGASEEDMLMWIIDRDKTESVKEHFEIKVGVEYIFDADNTFEFKEKVEHELPAHYGMYGVYTGGYNRKNYTKYPKPIPYVAPPQVTTQTQLASMTDKPTVKPVAKNDRLVGVDKLLSEEGMDFNAGDVIPFHGFENKPYEKSTATSKTRAIGYLPYIAMYVEVECHGVLPGTYEEDVNMFGKVVGAYKKNGTLTVLLTQELHPEKKPEATAPKHYCEVCAEEAETPYTVGSGCDVYKSCESCYSKFNDDDSDYPPFENDSDGNFVANVGGKEYTKSEWDKHYSTACGSCDEEIAFEEADGCETFGDAPICKHCDADMQTLLIDTTGSDSSDLFLCSSCDEILPLKLETMTGLCDNCQGNYSG
jgi:hypothetical protein